MHLCKKLLDLILFLVLILGKLQSRQTFEDKKVIKKYFCIRNGVLNKNSFLFNNNALLEKKFVNWMRFSHLFFFHWTFCKNLQRFRVWKLVLLCVLQHIYVSMYACMAKYKMRFSKMLYEVRRVKCADVRKNIYFTNMYI